MDWGEQGLWHLTYVASDLFLCALSYNFHSWKETGEYRVQDFTKVRYNQGKLVGTEPIHTFV